MAADKIKIELCMGSSCFARGNSSMLMALENYIEEKNLADRIELEGHLCLGKCNNGPHVAIDGEEYSGLDVDCFLDILRKKLEG